MESPPPQILQGEKFAVLALSSAWTRGVTSPANLAGGLWVLTAPPVDVGDVWREWLGSIRADEIADANLWFLAKRPSETPGVLDQENEDLKDEPAKHESCNRHRRSPILYSDQVDLHSDLCESNLRIEVNCDKYSEEGQGKYEGLLLTDGASESKKSLIVPKNNIAEKKTISGLVSTRTSFPTRGKVRYTTISGSNAVTLYTAQPHPLAGTPLIHSRNLVILRTACGFRRGFSFP